MSNIHVEKAKIRNKPSLSCTNCQKRKVKCDRKRPCLSCTRKNWACFYQKKPQPLIFSEYVYSSQHNRNSSDKSENDQNKSSNLDFRVTEGPDNVLNLHKGYCSVHMKEPFVRVNHGPLSWLSIFHKDPCLNYLWNFSNERGDITIYNKSIPQINRADSLIFKIKDDDERKDGSISERVFRRRILEQEGYDEKAPFKSLNNLEPEEFLHRTKNLNSTSVTFVRALFEGKFDTELHLFEKIKSVLPKKRALWSLVHIFFTTVYPFMPFLDQTDFTKAVIAILGPVRFSDEPFKEISVKRKLDLTIIAQLLIIIRLTYLSLSSKRGSESEHLTNSRLSSESQFDYNYLLSSPIHLTTIGVAKSCIDSFKITMKPSISLLQSLILMRFYHQLAPEFGDGVHGSDSVISSALLIQMAVSLGLNREPDDFVHSDKNQRQNHLARKLWAGLVEMSYLNSMFSGLPFTVNIKNSDVKKPFCNRVNSSIDDSDLELAIIDEYTWIPMIIPLDNYLNMILDINAPLLIKEFIHELSIIEVICLERLFTIKTGCMTKFGIFQEVKRAQLFLQIRSSIISINLHLYLHYEKLQETDKLFYYLNKNFLILLEELIPYYSEVRAGRYNQFGLYLIPFIETCFHKTDHLILMTFMRVMYLKQNILTKLSNNIVYNRRYNSLLRLEASLHKVGTLLIKVFSDFATKYYYSWRIAKSHSLFFKFVSERDFYESLTFPMISFNLNIKQLDHLEQIIGVIADKLSDATRNIDDDDQSTESISRAENLNNVCNTDTVADDGWLPLLPYHMNPNVDFEDNSFQDPSDIIGLYDFNLEDYEYLRDPS